MAIRPTPGFYIFQPVRTPAGVGLVVGFVRHPGGRVKSVIVRLAANGKNCDPVYFDPDQVQSY